jgi:hypothetical protein
VAAENCVGPALSNFLVSDQHDLRLLYQLMARCKNTNIRVCVTRFDLPRHRIPADKAPPAGVQTLMQVLACTDQQVETVVFNHLVDFVGGGIVSFFLPLCLYTSFSIQFA